MINIRQISVLPQIAKIYKKAIQYRLNNFLEKYNIINKSQYCFRSGISTAGALADVTECNNDNLEH